MHEQGVLMKNKLLSSNSGIITFRTRKLHLKFFNFILKRYTIQHNAKKVLLEAVITFCFVHLQNELLLNGLPW